MSLDEVLCNCDQIVAAFGSTECKECGLDYLFLPTILEYAAGIPDDELTSYAAFAIYKNYMRMCPAPCTCCASSYIDYIVDLTTEAADWCNYYFIPEKKLEDYSDRAPWY